MVSKALSKVPFTTSDAVLPACATGIDWPPTVSVAVRFNVLAFTAAANVRLLVPVPDPALTVSHDRSDAAVHAHVLPLAVTLTRPTSPDAGLARNDGVTVNSHFAACVI